jgi:hypothetical protein
MNTLYLISDQSLAWSAHFDKQVHCCVARAPREAARAASIPAQHSARLAHRALQTLRQSRLSLCKRPWSWAQVLPLGELPPPTAANGLRAAGAIRAGQHLTGGLSARARDPGRDLRDQPGAPASSRDTLSERGERDQSAHHFCRCPRDKRGSPIQRDAGRAGRLVRRDAHCQHVGLMDRCTGFVLHRRGERS